MANYTDGQTKKALECCINKRTMCKQCPLYSIDILNCNEKVAMAFALDLINRQEAEKAELQREIASYKSEIEALKDRNTTLEKMYMSCLPTPQTTIERLKKYQAERARDEHLRELYAEIEKLKEKNRLACQCTPKAIRRARAEAIKEFAERLKLHSYIVSDESQTGIINRYSVVTANQIDNLVKEMVGKNKNENVRNDI